MLRLFILSREGFLGEGNPIHGEAGLFLVVAEDETEARRLAADRAMNEGKEFWLTTPFCCTEIGIAGKTEQKGILLAVEHRDSRLGVLVQYTSDRISW